MVQIAKKSYLRSLFLLVFCLMFLGVQGAADNPDAPYMLGSNCSSAGTAPHTSIGGVGRRGEGAGLAVGDINRNGKVDMVLLAYDSPVGPNRFRYRIGWDINLSTWKSSNWSNRIEVAGVGSSAQGAGVALADIDGNKVLDMVLMAYDNPAGTNKFRYKIGWNLRADGTAASWSNPVRTAGFTAEASGAGIVVKDINGNGTLDILLAAYNRPDRFNFSYKIGWDIGADGKTSNWTAPIDVLGMAYSVQGADAAVADINLDGKPDLVLMLYDHYEWNTFRYRIGWSIKSNGHADVWSRWYLLKGFGKEGDGAGLTYYFHPLTGPRLVFMAYNDPDEQNNFRYSALKVTTSGACFGAANDKPPAPNNRLSVPADSSDQWGHKLFNLNMSDVQQTANDALSLFKLNCMLAVIFKEEAKHPEIFYDYPDNKLNFKDVVKNPAFSNEICPDLLVAAVAWYVDLYMGWVNDDVNDYVINNIHNLDYKGGDAIPAYYTLRYTNTNRYPDLVKKIADAPGRGWQNRDYYNDGKIYHGECEDFAILRHALLRALGFSRYYIWNGQAPGHEFNLVLYRGAYRIMDYGPIHTYFCSQSSETEQLNSAWNPVYGPLSSASWDDLLKHVLPRIYPDRCGTNWGWLFTKRAHPEIYGKKKCK